MHLLLNRLINRFTWHKFPNFTLSTNPTTLEFFTFPLAYSTSTSIWFGFTIFLVLPRVQNTCVEKKRPNENERIGRKSQLSPKVSKARNGEPARAENC
ncbi:hypothetical protein M5D96_005481, partial [Drosophila gunungcola]